MKNQMISRSILENVANGKTPREALDTVLGAGTFDKLAGDVYDELTAPVIYSYTRAQAIEDGFLVDLMQDEMESVCRQHYKHPVACTSAVFDIMQKAVENQKYCNDYAGVLHDMLWMSRTYKRTIDESTVIFRVIIKGAGRKSVYDFKMVCGPDDSGAPCMTIMLPSED